MLKGDTLNKTVIIALLAITSTPSLAKTKVFGEFHGAIDNLFAVGAESRNGFTLNDSIFGIKSSTEIKKDISFVYQFAWGADARGFESQSLSNIENRNQVIGLASPSGAVVIGRFDTPFKKVGEKADLFWHSQLGQNRNVTNAHTWDLRADKIIAFQTPVKKGFQGSIAYASDISDTSRITQNAKAVSLNGFYKKGKFQFGLGFEQHDLKNSSANTNALRLSANYRNGPLKMVGFYQQEDNDFAKTAEPDASVFGVGLAYRKAKGTFKAQLYRRDNDFSNKNTDLLALGYDYRLLRKLDVYAQAAHISNTASIGGEDFEGATGTVDMHGVSLGIRYRF